MATKYQRLNDIWGIVRSYNEEEPASPIAPALTAWFKRFEFYTDLLSLDSRKPYARKIQHWQQKHRLQHQAKQLLYALYAYQELTIQNSAQYSSRKAAIVSYMEKKMLELEVKQLYMLRKYTGFSRTLRGQSLEALNRTLHEKRVETHKNMQAIKKDLDLRAL